MSDSLIDKYAKRTPFPDPHRLELEEGETENRGCFGWLRGIRDRAYMLALHKKDGHVLALSYSWVQRIEYEPQAGITLYLPDMQVRVQGTGLNAEAKPTIRLLDGVIRHKVPWIRECDAAEILRAGDGGVAVERIDWEAE
jgi:hypothetical protein